MSGQSSGEKTEEPTAKKQRDARKKGQVGRSQEVVTTVSLAGVIAWFWFSWNTVVARLISIFDYAGNQYGKEFRSAALEGILFAFRECIILLLPPLALVLVFGILANFAQFGGIFSLESIKAKLENISPARGAKKIFAARQLVETLKSIVKIVFLSALLYVVIRNAIASYLNAVWCGLSCLTSVTESVLATTLLSSALAFVIVALFDIIYQRRQHHKSLMMTKEEKKREYKESEGDPVVKRQRKQLAEEFAFNSDVKRTESATALIVNPEHFAVALKYDTDVAPLPFVVAKGVNLHALQLRVHAEAAGVPVFRNVPLARSLHAETAINAYIPEEWFTVIAEILAWVSANRDSLYNGQLPHGLIDMESGDHLEANSNHIRR